jgi:putative addiction module component (TIGR02574 family)
MSVSIKSLGIDRLAVEDRLDLVEQIWDSIAADSEAVPLTSPANGTRSTHRGSHEANPDDVVSWEQVKAAVAERLKR